MTEPRETAAQRVKREAEEDRRRKIRKRADAVPARTAYSIEERLRKKGLRP
jgi:hypothetical protein